MKFLVISATFLFLHPSLVDEWVLFVDPAGQFEIRLPEDAEESSRVLETPVGNLEYFSLVSKETSDSSVVQYLLNYCDYPLGTFHPDSVELKTMFLEETITGAVEAVEGTLIYKDIVRGREFDGVIWKISSDKYDKQFKNMAVVDGDRFYNLQVIIPPELTLDNNADEFFDSFKLTHR